MGHSGRPLVAGPGLTAAFMLLLGAAALRLAGVAELAAGWDGIAASAVLWTAGFALMLLKAGPWLVTRRIGLKKVSGRPQAGPEGTSPDATKPA
jgi:uncharacterized protein involved in response to NO